MAARDRQYELVLLGPTGYTGRLTAEYITVSGPSNFKWALAGRNASRVSAVAQDIRSLNPDRLQPGIEVAELNANDLDALAKKTQLIISTVGPYSKYGTPVVEACAKNGTHYIDVSGEVPWLYDIIKKYHDTAKSTGAIMIPQSGFESAPADLIAWSLVALIRDRLSIGTKEVTLCVHDLVTGISGGTVTTALSIFDTYSVKEFMQATAPYALSPIPGPKIPGAPGVRTVPELGVMSRAINEMADRAIVYRSWGLIGSGTFYGRRFRFYEHMRVRNIVFGLLVNFALMLVFIILLAPPVRWLAKKLAHAPGSGPTKEEATKEHFEFRAIAIADQDSPTPARAYARMRYDGSMYYLTGILAFEAAMVILRGSDDVMAKKLRGGILTPATLGQEYLDRLVNAGIKHEVKLLEH